VEEEGTGPVFELTQTPHGDQCFQDCKYVETNFHSQTARRRADKIVAA